MKYLSAAILVVIFALSARYSWVPLALYLLLFRFAAASNIVRAMDALLAAMLGWSGRNTVSKECGLELKAGIPCRFCSVLCAILSYKLFGRWAVLEEHHCQKEAE